MVGKLRIRLSCVAPNQTIATTLPLLCERKKGAQQVGTAGVTLQVRGGGVGSVCGGGMLGWVGGWGTTVGGGGCLGCPRERG